MTAGTGTMSRLIFYWSQNTPLQLIILYYLLTYLLTNYPLMHSKRKSTKISISIRKTKKMDGGTCKISANAGEAWELGQ